MNHLCARNSAEMGYKMKKNYIGISNSFHDGSIAIVNAEGKIVFAEATERYLQNKRAINNQADQFICSGKLVEKYCEEDADIVVANTWSKDALQLTRESLNELNEEEERRREQPEEIQDLVSNRMAINRYIMSSQMSFLSYANRTLRYELSLMDQWKKASGFQVKTYNHHLTHAATACFTAPFQEGVCAILDGYGEGTAAQCYWYKEGKLSGIGMEENLHYLGASLGIFYMTVCDVCGFGFFRGEEWKVMGLAAYGKFNQEYYKIMKPMLKINGLKIEYGNTFQYSKYLYKLYSHKRKKGQPAIELADLAYTGQAVFSEFMYEYLNHLYSVTKAENLILGGGNFLNSWTNGEILKHTPFKKVHIFSAPGDDGNSLGAALLAYAEDNPDFRPQCKFQSPYLGSELSKTSIEHFIKFGGMNSYVSYHQDDIYQKTAELLSKGKIVGWIQGRAEFGPRALGNRSILADPRFKECKDNINKKVKFREEFRPFAPAILHEYGEQYFENYQETPYMERTLRFKEEMIPLIPGVVHVNQTGRLQTVKKEWNEKFYRLLEEFNKMTGVPVLLNTSFNVMGKPIIHSFEDALAVFYTSGIDALVVEDMLLIKPE